MKKAFLIALLIVGTIIAITATGTSEQGVDSQEAQAQTVYRTSWADTITNAANDTIVVSASFANLWTYNYVLDATQASGTTAIIAILQESNYAAGGSWYEVGRDTLAGTSQGRINTVDIATHILGQKHRVILDGSGTQVSPYALTLVAKRANN